MGLATSAKPEDLPDSVSAEELASWDTWRQRRRAAFTERLKQAEASHPNANEQEIQLICKNETEILKKRLCGVPFQSSIFLPGSPVSMHLKREMESDLAKHGLHRLTFDWNSSPSQVCLWNTVTVDITMCHWLLWAKQTNVEVTELTVPGIKACFIEWIANQGTCEHL